MPKAPKPEDPPTPDYPEFEASATFNADVWDGEECFTIRAEPGSRIVATNGAVANYLSTHPHVRRIK